MTESSPGPSPAGPALAAVARRAADLLADPPAAALFHRCLERTLTRAVRRLDDGTAFVVTGDIPAMWLRDASAAMWPYVRLCRDDEHLQDLVVRVLARQFRYVAIDPYANAFNAVPDGAGHRWDRPPASRWVWERKYEVDSLCYPLDLAHRFWRATGRIDHLDDGYRQAVERAMTVWTIEQEHDARSTYTFRRPLRRGLARRGRGPRAGVTGMTWSGFRPSDDACRYGYHVPQNMFAAVVLGQVADLAAQVLHDADLAQRAVRLREQIEAGIATHAVVWHPEHGRIYAYEVDGLGGVNLMDDANVPSLLAAPLLGFVPATDPLYQATRRFVLGPANPYFYAGAVASGVGSPHTPPRYVWPIALAVAGLTSPDAGEQRALIATLGRAAAAGAIPESFHCDRPDRYTRRWFCWADAMFCELVMAYCGL